MWRSAGPFRIHADYGELFGEWYYWAPGEAAQTEVDFLLRRDRDWIAIEAKGTDRPTSHCPSICSMSCDELSRGGNKAES